MLERIYFGYTVEAWIAGIGLAVATYAAMKVLRWVAVNRLTGLVGKTSTSIDDLILSAVKQTREFFLLIISLYVGSLALPPAPSHQPLVNSVVVIALLLQGALWGNNLISSLLENLIQRRKTEDASLATSLTGLIFMSKLLLWSVAVLLILENLGVNITALVAGLGIGGIAVALALQNVLGDLFASLSIVLDKPFVIGDFIIVDQYLGTVEHIGLKTTRIRSLSGEQVIFSNADLLKSRIRNFKRMYERRVLFTVGVTYDTPYEKLVSIGAMVGEIITAIPGTRFDRAHFKEYTDSSLLIEVVYFVKNPDFNVYMDIQQTINLEIYRRFKENGIEFAFPTRTVYVQQTPDGREATQTTLKQ